MKINLSVFLGGAFDELGNAIDISFQRNGLPNADKLWNGKTPVTNESIDEEVVFLGQYRNQWGSFLVDSISRLWFSLEHPEKYKYIYLHTQTGLGEIHPNAWKFLNALGISSDQVMLVKHPVRCKRVIFPEMSFIPYGTLSPERKEIFPSFHQEYIDTVYKVVNNIAFPNISAHEKVYFSRGKFSAKSKTDYGEKLIAELLKANGYYIVYPEEHTIEEQIFYVNTCKIFATIGGSCAHNIIFSKTKPKMILFNRMNEYQWHQWMINEMAGVSPITYVDMYCEPYKGIFNTTISGPYLYLINDNVKALAHDEGYVIPQKVLSGLTTNKIKCKYSARVLRSILSQKYHSIIG